MPYHLALFCVILIPLTLPISGYAAFETGPPGARAAGLAGAFVAVADDANSPFSNPAGMSQLIHPELTGYYTVLYGVDGLRRVMLATVIPTPVGGIGFSYHGFGGDLYRETAFGVSYSRSLFSRILVGVTARALTLTIARYGTAHLSVIDTGILLRLPGQVRLGVAVHALNHPRIAGRRDEILRTLHAGVSRTGTRIMVAAQIDREPGQPTTGRIGQEFLLTPRLAIRSGVVTNPSMVFAGIGVRLPHIETSYAVSSHPVLGLTHRFSLSFRFKGHTKR